MESWLEGSKGQKIVLKERNKKPKVDITERKHEIDMADVEEVEDFNTTLQENPFKQDLLNFDDVNKKYSFLKLGKGTNKGEDLTFLANEFTCHDSLDEPDVPWDFKTLRTEIASIISAIYDVK